MLKTNTMKPNPDSMTDSTTPVYVSAVMPCLNEERTLGTCIRKAQQSFLDHGIAGEVIVADNGSSDRSVEVAASFGARVVHEGSKGYGAALTAGIRASNGKIIVMADADDSYDWLTLGEFVKSIEAGNDLVMGNRFHGGIKPGAMPLLHQYLGNPVLSSLTRLFYRIPIGDFHCGMRAFTRDAFERMQVRTTGMEFATEMVVHAAHAGLKISEIPTCLYPDKRGRPPHLRSFRDGWRHLRFLLTYAPDHLYFIPGGLMLLIGLTGLVSLASGPLQLGRFTLGIHFVALSSMLTLLGANIVSFGVLAKVINARLKPIADGTLLYGFLKCFTLEGGLIFGLGLAFVGAGIDVAILMRWIHHHLGNMESTVHLAFVATTIFVLGVNILFGSFLLRMLQEEAKRR
jgi:hypothetical protein